MVVTHGNQRRKNREIQKLNFTFFSSSSSLLVWLDCYHKKTKLLTGGLPCVDTVEVFPLRITVVCNNPVPVIREDGEPVIKGNLLILD